MHEWLSIKWVETTTESTMYNQFDLSTEHGHGTTIAQYVVHITIPLIYAIKSQTIGITMIKKNLRQ